MKFPPGTAIAAPSGRRGYVVAIAERSSDHPPKIEKPVVVIFDVPRSRRHPVGFECKVYDEKQLGRVERFPRG